MNRKLKQNRDGLGMNVNIAMYERGDRVPGSSPVAMDGNPTTFSEAINVEGNGTGTGHIVNDDVFKADDENQDLYVDKEKNKITRKYSDSDEDSVGVYRVASITAVSDVGSNGGLPAPQIPDEVESDESEESDDHDQLYGKDRVTKDQ